MGAHREEYRRKLTCAETAAGLITSDTDISMGMALGEPPALLTALSARLEAGELHALRLWYFHSMPHAGQTILRYELLDRIRPRCMFMGAIERELIRRGDADGRSVVDFVPVAFSAAPDLLRHRVALDTFVTAVSPMDEHGFFTFGTNNDYANAAARAAKRLIVEVNPAMPRVHGDSMLHISEVDVVIENETPLFQAPLLPPEPEDEIIGKLIADLAEDGACLQMGIGALPNAVCRHLRDRRDLGIHTELLSPGLVDLIECGAVTNRKKETFPGRSVFTFAIGEERMYRLLHDNLSINSHPVDIVNDPRHVAKNDKVFSVNATLQIDLMGACNSEHMMGRQYSGSGGQLDFVRGANASRGGVSVIACHSTARDGTVSRITPELGGPVTTPRNDTDFVVTEFGVAKLKGRSASQRAEAMIGLAHPRFREELTAAARKARIL